MGHQKKLQSKGLGFCFHEACSIILCWRKSTIWRTCYERRKMLRPCLWFIHLGLFFIYLIQKLLFHSLLTNPCTQQWAFLMYLLYAFLLGQGRWVRDGSYRPRAYNLLWERSTERRETSLEVCRKAVGGGALIAYLSRSREWGEVMSRTTSQRRWCLNWVL